MNKLSEMQIAIIMEQKRKNVSVLVDGIIKWGVNRTFTRICKIDKEGVLLSNFVQALSIIHQLRVANEL